MRLPPTLALARKWGLDRRPPFASALPGCPAHQSVSVPPLAADAGGFTCFSCGGQGMGVYDVSQQIP